MTIILYTRIHQIENIISVSLRTDAVRRISTKCVIYFLNMVRKSLDSIITQDSLPSIATVLSQNTPFIYYAHYNDRLYLIVCVLILVKPEQ